MCVKNKAQVWGEYAGFSDVASLVLTFSSFCHFIGLWITRSYNVFFPTIRLVINGQFHMQMYILSNKQR